MLNFDFFKAGGQLELLYRRLPAVELELLRLVYTFLID
ncbi:hypothetical protein STA3757_44320 [Stanieria sp. NIES-3757]|nr:hypothetical protein STA3757_44320 [Stanieria sp. NIES-3757]